MDTWVDASFEEAVVVAGGDDVCEGGSTVGAGVMASEAGVEAVDGFDAGAAGRRPAFGLKDKPPVFFSIELMAGF